jgi:hypothetical protein
MKHVRFWMGIFAVAVLAGCEQIIDLDTPDHAALPAISLRLDAATGAVVGSVTRSVDFYAPALPDAVTDVVVRLTGPDGTVYTVAADPAGFIAGSAAAFAPGDRVVAEVEVEGEVYRTEEVVQPVLPLDSLEIRPFEGFGFGFEEDSVVQIFCHFPDSPPRNLLVEAIVNGEYATETVQCFKTSGEGPTVVPVLWGRTFSPGDEVLVFAWSLPEASYDYWVTLGNVADGGGPGSVPGNPLNHWNRAALGHFTLAPASTLTITVP